MTWRHKTVGLVASCLGIDLRESYREVVVETETEWKDPIDELSELPDEDGRIYCWHVGSEAAGRQMNSILREEFVKRLGREPRAIHLVITDDEQLRELDPEQFRAQVQPFGGER